MATRDEVLEYLSILKGSLMLGSIQVKDREKNRQYLFDLDITPNQRREVLLQLTPEDYSAGPEPDEAEPDKEVWKFGREVDGKEIYIKLRVVPDPQKRDLYHPTLWSFHVAEHRIYYPFK